MASVLKASDILSAPGIHTVGIESASALADITADAFRDDPFNRWLFGDFEPMRRTFANLAPYLRAERILSDPERRGGRACRHHVADARRQS